MSICGSKLGDQLLIQCGSVLKILIRGSRSFSYHGEHIFDFLSGPNNEKNRLCHLSSSRKVQAFN